MPEDSLLWSVVLIGSAGIATGVVGVLLPAGRRIEVLLALVAGAGSGLATFAAELLFGTGNPADPAPQFLYATIVGWLTTIAVLAALWLRSRRDPGSRGSEPPPLPPAPGPAAS